MGLRSDRPREPTAKKLAPPRFSLMHRTSIVDHRVRSLQRFGNLVAEVSRHARDGEEAVQIERVVDAVNTGVLCPREAHASLVSLRLQQRQAA